MKNNKFLLFLSILLLSLSTFFLACDDPPPEEEETPLVYTELTADKDTLAIGETVTFHATASGKDIVYNWVASAGALLGSGAEVTLTPSPCLSGDILVTCSVKDAYNNTKSKNVTVTIVE
ncbi:MAG TPA: hypothetical protein PLL66_07845 [Bacteroidales bacterium]|nr:hypothetical protein [Bacteroidales bacterium]